MALEAGIESTASVSRCAFVRTYADDERTKTHRSAKRMLRFVTRGSERRSEFPSYPSVELMPQKRASLFALWRKKDESPEEGRSHSVIFAHNCAAAAGEAGTPVLGRLDLLQAVQLPDLLETFVDELPGARTAGVDFAAVFARAAARAVEHVLGAAGDRTNPAVEMKRAGAAGRALFRPDAAPPSRMPMKAVSRPTSRRALRATPSRRSGHRGARLC